MIKWTKREKKTWNTNNMDSKIEVMWKEAQSRIRANESLRNCSHKLTIERKKESEVAQSCPTLCNPMDCKLPGSSVHGILQARILGWVAIPFFLISCIADRFFTVWATREALCGCVCICVHTHAWEKREGEIHMIYMLCTHLQICIHLCMYMYSTHTQVYFYLWVSKYEKAKW